MKRQPPPRSDSTLVNRNIRVGERRTSLRLELPMWEALSEVAGQRGLTIHELCTAVDRQRRQSSLTAAIRVFLLDHFRTQAKACRQGLTEARNCAPPLADPALSSIQGRVENSGQ